jgi:hypothetical protein
MYAMQYEITLPADYDMEIIRKRVATRGHLLDAFPGLGVKAYLMSERGVDGAPVNAYAPFYLWHDVSGMNQFLWGGAGFQGIVSDFGRPTVWHWTGAAFFRGPASDSAPLLATRDARPIPAGADLIATMTEAVSEAEQRAALPGVHSTAVAVDPHHWSLLHFTLWQRASTTAGARFQVLHLSAPHLADLPVGAHWSPS